MSENSFLLVQKSQNIYKVMKFRAFLFIYFIYFFKLIKFVFNIVVYCDKKERKERFITEMSSQMYDVAERSI